MLVVAFTDYTTDRISFSIFYLIPITFVTWYAGRLYGMIFSFCSAIIWYVVEFSNNTIEYDPAVPYWNALVRFGFFLIVTVLLSMLKNLQKDLEEKVKERTSDLEKEIYEHKKAKTELTLKSTQLRELNRNIESIREEQNTRIAREVHDELGQSLTAINLELMWISKKYSTNSDIVNRMNLLSEIVSNTIGTVRKISSDLRPRLLDQLGLVSAIESQLKEFSNRTNVDFQFYAPDSGIMINNNSSITVFRIFQEAITNVARHAEAKNVVMKIEKTQDKNILMVLKDDGKGFNVNEVLDKTKSLGLIGMKERAAVLGGDLNIYSSSKGTEISLKIPT